MPGDGRGRQLDLDRFTATVRKSADFATDRAGYLPAVHDDVRAILDVTPSHEHRQIARRQRRKSLWPGLDLQRTRGPDSGLRVIDIDISAQARGERADEFSRGRTCPQLVAGERCPATACLDIHAALERRVELQRHGSNRRATDKYTPRRAARCHPRRPPARARPSIDSSANC